MASLGVLLVNRAAWLLSVLLSAGCIVQVARTYFPTRHEVLEANEQIARTGEAYAGLRKVHVGANEDETAIAQFDPDGNIRAARQALMKSTKSDDHPGPHSAK